MKKHEIIFSIIKIPLDFIVIFSSFYIARNIRNLTDLIPGIHLPIQTINNKELFYFALTGAFLYVFLFSIHKLYQLKITSSKIKEILGIIRYSIYWFIFFSAIIYFAKDFIYEKEIPRLVILFTLFIGIFLVILGRIILNFLQKYLLKNGFINKRNIALITSKSEKSIKEIIDDIKSSNVYNIAGYINTKKIKSLPYSFLGTAHDIKNILSNDNIDEILFIDSKFNKIELFSIWDYSRIYGIRYRYITNSFDVTKTNTTISLLNKIPVVEIKNTSLDNWGRVIKRLIDIFGSLLGILIFSPLLIITAIAIKIEDPKGPIVYKNRRVGQNGKIFNLYKFRYIKWKYCIKDSYGKNENEDEALKFEQELIKQKSTRNGPLYKIKDDPRKTKIGTFIEKYSIDEIPQFFNVIIGNMSLVGPRPHQPREVQNYEDYHKRVLTIKPGISGMAQVNGRENNNFDSEVKLDIFYLENWNILLDVKIIFKTFTTIFKR